MPQATPTREDIQWRRRRKGSAAFVFTSQRLSEVDRLHAHRYGGPIIPGIIGDVEIALSLLARYDVTKRDWLMHNWIDQHAPWLGAADREQMITGAKVSQIKWTPISLGNKLGLTIEERTLLDIRTFRAVGMTKKVQRQLRKERDRERKRIARRDAGLMTREEFETTSTSRMKPWEAQKISRATWYRQQKQPETSYIADRPVSRVISHATVTIRIV